MRFGGVERSEDVFHAVRIDPWAGILNGNVHGSRRVQICLDREDAGPVSDSAQRIQGIHHQVHQDLLYLDAVRGYLAKIWAQSSLHGYLTPLGLSFGERDDFSNHLVETEPGLDRFAIFQKRANSGHNLARPAPVTNDPLKRLASFV